MCASYDQGVMIWISFLSNFRSIETVKVTIDIDINRVSNVKRRIAASLFKFLMHFWDHQNQNVTVITVHKVLTSSVEK